MKRIAVIGAGGWGTALANHMASKTAEVSTEEAGASFIAPSVALWGFEPALIEQLRVTRVNTPFLPGIRLHDTVHPTADMREAVEGAELVLVVPPSKGMRAIAARLAETGLPSSVPLVSFTKGIEAGSGLRMSEILQNALPAHPVAVLSGPSHAEEVALSMPTAVVLGCADEALASQIQHALLSPAFRVYTSTDSAGIELGGALKNIFAIAAGVSDGLGFGDNSKAALVTRALVELVRIGTALGGRRATFRGLSGIGDLMVTCFSKHSRNRAVGERLGKGETPEQIAASMQMVAEGVPTALSAHECARRLGVETPIIDAVYGLLYEKKSPQEVLTEILAREPKPEEE